MRCSASGRNHRAYVLAGRCCSPLLEAVGSAVAAGAGALVDVGDAGSAAERRLRRADVASGRHDASSDLYAQRSMRCRIGVKRTSAVCPIAEWNGANGLHRSACALSLCLCCAVAAGVERPNNNIRQDWRCNWCIWICAAASAQ